MSKQTRALQWFGSDASVASQYAALLSDCKHVTVPFCGGLSVVAHLVKTASEIVCNDAHKLAINFYTVVADPDLRWQLLDRLDRVPFHPDLLAQAQDFCKAAHEIESSDVSMAFFYFITNWMGRGGKGGTASEFNGALPIRWTASGGSSPKRFNTAVRSIQDYWGPICERCSFICCDWREILKSLQNTTSPTPRGIYCDPPWHAAGDKYANRFTREDHRHLAKWLTALSPMERIVVRYDDHPNIREDYTNSVWRIRTLTSRDQANNGVGELCITNRERHETF